MFTNKGSLSIQLRKVDMANRQKSCFTDCIADALIWLTLIRARIEKFLRFKNFYIQANRFLFSCLKIQDRLVRLYPWYDLLMKHSLCNANPKSSCNVNLWVAGLHCFWLDFLAFLISAQLVRRLRKFEGVDAILSRSLFEISALNCFTYSF